MILSGKCIYYVILCIFRKTLQMSSSTMTRLIGRRRISRFQYHGWNIVIFGCYTLPDLPKERRQESCGKWVKPMTTTTPLEDKKKKKTDTKIYWPVNCIYLFIRSHCPQRGPRLTHSHNPQPRPWLLRSLTNTTCTIGLYWTAVAFFPNNSTIEEITTVCILQ